MAECSTSNPTPTPAPTDSVVTILRKLQRFDFCFDVDDPDEGEPCTNNPGLLFDRILSVFFREIYKREEIRPLPVMLGDGHSVDLFKLYSSVQEQGGYNAVTDNCGWQSVAEAVGFDPAVGPSLKLVFSKYLYALDLLLQRVSGKIVMRELTGYKSPSFSAFKHCSPVASNRKKVFESEPLSCTKKIPSLMLLDDVGSGKNDAVILEEGISTEGINHRKRKRQTFARMLHWIRDLAKNTVDPSLTKGLSASDDGKGNAHAVGELYSQTLLARQARLFKRTRRRSLSSSHSQVEKDKKINTFVLENGVGSSSRTKSTKNNQRLQSDGWSSRYRTPARIGIRFQVEVPVWTGQPPKFSIDSDASKWLGTRTWPLENHKRHEHLDYALIGRGRPNTCSCEKQGSVECIRFHIVEKRLQTKCELGRAFHDWKFEWVGDEVSLAWTEEEEKMFRNIVFQNRPSLKKDFWRQLCLNFPFKRRKSIACYYFNVFLLGRRRYQNHVTTKNIDSDDDEAELGFLSNSFGHAAKIYESKSLVCTQNAQCMDIDS